MRLLMAVLIGLSGAIWSSAWAQEKDLSVTLTVAKVVTSAEGKESLEPGENAKPGDILEYTATYRNQGKKSVKRVEATIPVPGETEYLPGSARPAGARASADGQQFQVIPLRRKVKSADGKETTQLVPYGEYRALRWFPGDLAAGKEAKFSLRARVRNADSAAPNVGDGDKK